MKHILILRHAKSSWDEAGLSDFDRPLAKRGIEDAPMMGKFVKKTGLIPDLVYSSPALRANQTTELFCKAATVQNEKIYWNDRFYYGSPADYIKAVHNIDSNDKDIILLVGHNPLVESTVSLLCSNGENNLIRMPTAALVCLECQVSAWKNTGKNTARLKWMMTPRLLKKIQ
ncbi:MAG: histidine phosphatase family protein [Balneolaceae bacterium]